MLGYNRVLREARGVWRPREVRHRQDTPTYDREALGNPLIHKNMGISTG